VFAKLNQDETVMETLEDKGTVFGSLSFLCKKPMQFNLRAESDCFFYEISEETIERAR